MKLGNPSGFNGVPPSPYGSPPIYLPFTGVQAPLVAQVSTFSSSAGYNHLWYPYARVTEAGWNQGLLPVLPLQGDMWAEYLDYALPAGIQDVIIPFAVEKISPALLLMGAMIINLVDASPLSGVAFIVEHMSTSLIAIQLNCLLDSGNYRFQALVTVAQ